MLIACALMTIGLFSCSSPTLQDVVDKMKKELPKDLGDGTSITKVEIADDFLEITMECDESNFRFDDVMIDLFMPMIQESMKEQVLNEGDGKELKSLCKQENKGVRMKMIGLASGKTIVPLEVPANELPD